MHRRTAGIVSVSITLVITAACSSGATDSTESAPTDATTVTSLSTGSADFTTTSTAAPAPASTTTTSSTTTTTTSSTTTTTTIAPDVAEACRSLDEDAFFTRSSTFDSLAEPDAVSAVCPDAVEAIVEAQRVLDASDEIDGLGERLSVFFECSPADGRAFQIFDHDFERDLGAVFRVVITSTDANGATVVRSSRIPGVDVAIRPSRRVRMRIDFPSTDLGGTCESRGTLFVGEDPDLPGDIARPVDRSLPPQPLDDASTWFAELLEAERAHRSVDGDEALALLDDFADLRSSAYATDPESRLQTFVGAELDDPDATYDLCDVVPVDDADRYAVVTYARSGLTTRNEDAEPGAPLESLDTVSAGLLRRGDDGRWRWLTEPLRLSADVTTCDAWRAAL